MGGYSQSGLVSIVCNLVAYSYSQVLLRVMIVWFSLVYFSLCSVKKPARFELMFFIERLVFSNKFDLLQ